MASTVAATTVAAPAHAACDEARVTSDVAALPPAWRRGLEALLRAASQEGHPWSCTGALVTLTLEGPAGPGVLTVTPIDAPLLARAVESPDDLVPVGEALLARPLARPTAAVTSREASTFQSQPVVIGGSPRVLDRDPRAPGDQSVSRRLPDPREPREPRLLIDVLGSTRWSGSPAALWAGGVARANLPFDAWSMGIWGRLELAVAELQPVPLDFTMWSGSVGLSVGRRIVARPLELTASFDASVAIVSMDGGLDTPPLSATGAKADLRLGTRLQGAVPFGARWRGVFALDGELGPAALASPRHRIIDARLPPIPAFTLGASLGGEIALQ